jgi:hypothetical protein
MRSPNPDHICGLCDEFDVDRAAPECAARGMGYCIAHGEDGYPEPHVQWDGMACITFRLDRPNLRRRRQFIDVQRRARDQVEDDKKASV